MLRNYAGLLFSGQPCTSADVPIKQLSTLSLQSSKTGNSCCTQSAVYNLFIVVRLSHTSPGFIGAISYCPCIAVGFYNSTC